MVVDLALDPVIAAMVIKPSLGVVAAHSFSWPEEEDHLCLGILGILVPIAEPCPSCDSQAVTEISELASGIAKWHIKSHQDVAIGGCHMAARQARDPRTDTGALRGEHLRQLRIDAGFEKQAHLGTELNLDRTAIAKFETGERVPNEANLNEWLDACGVQGRERDLVKSLSVLAHNKEHPEEARAIPYYETEAQAHTLRFWAPLLIPGLLQTADYAREVYIPYRHSPEAIERYVAKRIERQKILTEEGPSVTAVLWEPVLNNLIGTPEVMRKQLAHLIDFFDHPRVNIHVLAASLGANIGLGGAINLATTDTEEVLLTDRFSEDSVTAESAQVRAAAVTFDGVRADALNRAATQKVLTDAMERWSS